MEEEYIIIIQNLIDDDKTRIKRFIYENFIEKGYDKHILTDAFLNSEMYNCIKYSLTPNLPYMNELYLAPYRVKIYDIIKYVKYGPGLRYLRLTGS